MPGAIPFMGLVAAATIWTAGNALELLVRPIETKILLARIQYFGIVGIGPCWLLFILEYTRQVESLDRIGRRLIWVIPLVCLALVWTNDFHRLIWTGITPAAPGPGAPLIYAHGPGFWLLVVYSYVLLLAGSVGLIRTIRRKPHLYRKQAGGLLVSAAIPWLGNLLYLLGFTPVPGLDLTPPAFLISTIALGWSLFSFRLLDLPPLTRDVILENMIDGVLVVDSQFRLTDMNTPVERMFGLRRDDYIGRPIWDMLPEAEAALQPGGTPEGEPMEIDAALPVQRCLELRSTRLSDARGRPAGRLVILRDLTERKQQQNMIRIQQDALDAADRDRRRLIEAEAIAQERNRIAQEIHDGLAQNLAALRMRISLWRDYMTSEPEKMLEELDEVEAMVAGGLLEARRSIYALRPPALAGQKFFPALRSYIRGFSEYYRFEVNLESVGDESAMPEDLELTMFRVIQEALNNTARHSGARHAAVRIDLSDPERLSLVIADDGRGFNPLEVGSASAAFAGEGAPESFTGEGSFPHIGLEAMRERVEAAGGSFGLEAAPGRGTCLRIEFPLRGRQNGGRS